MIITDEKPWEEIVASLDEFKVKKIVIAACGVCSAKVGTGGTEGAAKMKAKLEENGYEIITTIVIDEPCDNRMSKQALRKIKDEVAVCDGILSLGCGMGSQSLWKLYDKYGKPVITALDTIFMGETEKFGLYNERCRACGNCYLNETGGVCPIAMCAKSMLNGPCGGSVGGKCEVGNYTQDCGWILIYNALKSIDRLDLFLKIRKPRNWSGAGAQRSIQIPREGPTPGVPCKETSFKTGGV
ncbi:MAG: 5,10-methylenetetrahydrofolate reductase [archaeon]|nr:5,10-methylenetetrahydrofolate reductase [archaeon]